MVASAPHTFISSLSYSLWGAVWLGQTTVAVAAWNKARPLSLYMGMEAVYSVAAFAVARLCSVEVYGIVWQASIALDWLGYGLLLFLIYRAMHLTGLPGRFARVHRGFILFSALAAIASARFPLASDMPNYGRMIFTWDHVVSTWLCWMLGAAPFYAFLRASAKSQRILLIYLGSSFYMAVHTGLVDAAILSRLSRVLLLNQVTSIVSLLCLGLWFAACRVMEPSEVMIDLSRDQHAGLLLNTEFMGSDRS